MPKQRTAVRLGALVVSAMMLAVQVETGPAATPISIYGAWHCGSDFCTWASVRNLDGVRPEEPLADRPRRRAAVGEPRHPQLRASAAAAEQDERLADSQGVPIGMTQEVVDYFKSRNIRVMLSIGGITYVDAWNQALAANGWQLGLNAAEVAQRMGVGIEIDYEENSNPNIAGLQAFINAYRSMLPYDASGADHAARLTIDLAAGDRWLIALTQKATADWLVPGGSVLDYANAMVPARQPRSTSDAIANWQEHVDGKPRYSPPIGPLAPAKFTGSLYIVTGNRAAPECVTFSTSLQKSTGTFVQTIAPNGAGLTNGMLGLHVLGRRVSGHALGLHDTAQ